MDQERALSYALWLLGRKARTEAEMRTKLEGKKFDQIIIDSVIKKLKDQKLIDDLKYAVNYQRTRDDYKPMGSRRLKQELYKKGIAKDILESVKAEPDKEFDLALKAAETRLRQYARLDKETFRRRLSSFLTRRGFSYPTIKQVLTKLKELE